MSAFALHPNFLCVLHLLPLPNMRSPACAKKVDITFTGNTSKITLKKEQQRRAERQKLVDRRRGSLSAKLMAAKQARINAILSDVPMYAKILSRLLIFVWCVVSPCSWCRFAKTRVERISPAFRLHCNAINCRGNSWPTSKVRDSSGCFRTTRRVCCWNPRLSYMPNCTHEIHERHPNKSQPGRIVSTHAHSHVKAIRRGKSHPLSCLWKVVSLKIAMPSRTYITSTHSSTPNWNGVGIEHRLWKRKNSCWRVQ
jgi:hypothetical protein